MTGTAAASGTASAMTATATAGHAASDIAASDVAASDVAIEVEGLTKSFDGKVVVRDLTMTVRRGLIYGFLGPNGSGKTTTIRMLCGLLTPDSGRGTCLGYDILTQSDKIKSRVGYMTQRFSLYQDLSVRENLEFIARIYGMPRTRAGRRAPRSRGSASPAARSSSRARCRAAGSSASRSAPARCPIRSFCCSTSRPRASIPRRAASSGTEIHALAANGLTVLVSTHYMDEAERCHEIAYIAYGELLAQGTVARGHRAIPASPPMWSPGPASTRSPTSCASATASRWWRRSARASMSPAATPGRSTPRSHPIATIPRSPGSAPSRRWRTCSSS